jgi:prophage antirepressor-like protein
MYAYKDLCRVLDIKSMNDAKQIINQNGVAVLELNEEDGKQKVVFVNEANMQRLYKFSDNEDLGGVIDWLVGIVVPRTKMYGDFTVDEVMTDPDKIVKILEENQELALKNKLLESKLNIESFRVKTYNSFYGERESVPLMFLADYFHINNITQTELMQILRGQDVVQPNDLPYQKYIDIGYFRIDEHRCTRNGELEIRQTPIVFKPGMNFIRKLLLKVAGENNG